MPGTVSTVSADFAGRALTIETGLLAEQASGSVVVRYGDTMLLVAVTGSQSGRDDIDFFPLSVDYEEKMYAAGKIPGGFIKREGRPTENAVLAGRLTDRPIRPLFPKGYRNEVQIISTVLSADQENAPDILSIIGASAALTLSPIPFDGPIGAARIGLIDGELVVNPYLSQYDDSELNMVVAGTTDAIMMVEGEASQVSEETMVQAIELAHQEIRRIVDLQLELKEASGKEKWAFTPPAENQELLDAVTAYLGDKLSKSLSNPDKVMRIEGTDVLKRDLKNHFATPADGSEPRFSAKEVSGAFEQLLKQEVREGILVHGNRPDGRGPNEIRPIWSQVGYLPRAHGSAIFTRGQTQALTVVTLGSAAEEQRLDSIGPEDRKRYIHHYNFPPYSVGEVRRMIGPSRRDIGHGALAERALLAVIPSVTEFPYTMRLVSEVVSSNGSTSMASVCGSSMALMDAGVPITAPVAGVAMGLVTDPDSGRYTVLTDIQGIEDALGDMDFKVAGTAAGVTAIQMDIKVKGITPQIMREALAQAHEGRQHILGKMLETIDTPRNEMSPFAPRVTVIKINPEKIGAVIGPGGKMIRALQDETGTKIEIQDDGTVSISSTDPEGAQRALDKIKSLTQEFNLEKGDVYTGKIVSIMPYGAFVEIIPGKDGLVHISEMSDDPSIRVERVEDLYSVGDEITVMVIEVAPNGKISLSRRAALTGIVPEDRPRPQRREFDRGGGRSRDDRGPRGPRQD
ncbi:polyribonucleotide nucleotidyltransferase [soil metagenome]